MSQGELSIGELRDYLERLLSASHGKNYCPNGLQVEGRRPVRRIATGVSSCLELFERARDLGADAVLVHHGLFWDGMGRELTGTTYRRVATLIENGMHLLAYHLPLDRHPELGNNVLAARALGLSELQSFAEYAGLPIGFRGRLPEPIAPATLVDRCRNLFGQEPLAFLSGPPSIHSVGIVSGGAPGEIHAAIAAGLDAYITGEATEWVMNIARENRIHFLAVGHYASERLGIRALGDHLAHRFGLAHDFIDIPNPI
ncbi:MAG: Nif3-like dinuclear metal center hexameric protein [Thermoanaerobaculia bacterium]